MDDLSTCSIRDISCSQQRYAVRTFVFRRGVGVLRVTSDGRKQEDQVQRGVGRSALARERSRSRIRQVSTMYPVSNGTNTIADEYPK